MTEARSWSSNRKAALRRDSRTCQRCSADGGEGSEHDLQVHHITPRENGGNDKLSNLITLCVPCHDAVHTGVSNDEVARYTGDEFFDWIDGYDGPEMGPWDSEYICTVCGYVWTGKPLFQRESTSVNCPRNSLHAHVCIEVGEILFPAHTIKTLRQNGEPLNYTGIEFFEPYDRSGEVGMFEYKPESMQQPIPYQIYTETSAECIKCGVSGAREYSIEIEYERFNETRESEHLLCQQCKSKLEPNELFRVVE